MQIGLLVDTVAVEQQLKVVAAELGLVDFCTFRLSEFKRVVDSGALPAGIPWLLCCNLDAPETDWLDDWLAGIDCALVFDLPPTGSDQVAGWRRRVAVKLSQLQGIVKLEAGGQKAARRVCVVAASTGGPEAVREFFSVLPANLDIAWIYIQHIDPGYESTLINMLNRNGQYPVKAVQHGAVLAENEVLLVSGHDRFDLMDNGTFIARGSRWPGVYQPSINQLIANVSAQFGDRVTVIFFTGMGDDGVIGARLIKQAGGTIWAQSPVSCVAASMPQTIIDAGLAEYQSSPVKLAKKLVSELVVTSSH